MAILVSGCFRRSVGRLATAALVVGTFLAIPHAFLYDMPMIAGAMALFIEARLETSSTFSAGDILVLILALLFPAIMMNISDNVPVNAIPMLLLFALIIRDDKSRTELIRRTSTLTGNHQNFQERG